MNACTLKTYEVWDSHLKSYKDIELIIATSEREALREFLFKHPELEESTDTTIREVALPPMHEDSPI